MKVVRLLVNDSFAKCLGFTEEAFDILYVGDNNGVEDSEDERSDGQRHRKRGKSCISKKTILYANNKTVGTEVVRNQASRDHMGGLDCLQIH